MNAKQLRAFADGLTVLQKEAQEIARLRLSDAERIEAERALQRKAHAFVEEMSAKGVSSSVDIEHLRRTIQAALVRETCALESGGRTSRREAARRRRALEGRTR